MTTAAHPIEVQKALSGVDYPASKDDLVNYAKENSAANNIVDALGELEDREYSNPADVNAELAGGGEKG